MIGVDGSNELERASTPPLLCVGRLSRKPGENRRVCEKRRVAEMLAQHYGQEVRLEYQPSGAPFLPEYPDDFISISHSDCFVLIAIAAHPIGVDIEDIGSQVERVEKKFVHPRELDRLDEVGSRSLALHLLWAAKEAAYKLVNPPSASLREFRLSLLDSYNPTHRLAFFLLRTSSDDEVNVLLTWTEEYVMAMANY